MRIVLSGYYGFDNAGDEALVTAISSSLRLGDESLDITVLSGNPQQTARNHGVRAVSRVNPLVLIKELYQADLLISGGGSLLQDVTGPLSIPYYLGIVVLAKLMKTPVVFYAQGVGPVNGRLGRWLIKVVANRVELITLRDAESAQFLDKIGVNRPPVWVTADPVFSLQPGTEELAEAKAYLNSLGLDQNQGILGISLRSWSDFSDRQISLFLDSLSESGTQLLLLPLQHPADLEYSRRINRLMKKPAAIAEKPMNSTQLMGLISHLSALVGMRLHSLIFAACEGIPFEGISYDPKVETFLQIFGKDPLFSDDNFDPVVAAQTAIDSIAGYSAQSAGIEQQVTHLKEKADQNAHLVTQMLKRSRT